MTRYGPKTLEGLNTITHAKVLGTLTSVSNDSSGIQDYSCGAYENLDGTGESSIYLTGSVAYFRLHRFPNIPTLMDSFGSFLSSRTRWAWTSALAQSFFPVCFTKIVAFLPPLREERGLTLSVCRRSTASMRRKPFVQRLLPSDLLMGRVGFALRSLGTSHRLRPQRTATPSGSIPTSSTSEYACSVLSQGLNPQTRKY